jgi:rod shape-determining protein MreD
MERDRYVLNIKRSILSAFIFILQFMLADHLRIFGVAPNIAFSFVLAVALLNDFPYMINNALFLGIALDAVSGRIFGAYTFMFVFIAFAISELYHSAFSENFVIESLYALIATLLYSVLFAFLHSFFRGSFFILLSKITIIEWIYNFAIFIVFRCIQGMFKRKRKSIFSN